LLELFHPRIELGATVILWLFTDGLVSSGLTCAINLIVVKSCSYVVEVVEPWDLVDPTTGHLQNWKVRRKISSYRIVFASALIDKGDFGVDFKEKLNSECSKVRKFIGSGPV
jgi:hypothetical protein